MITAKTISAIYTGGGVWLFVGETSEESFFLMDDYGCVEISDENPKDFDDWFNDSWINAHIIREIEDGPERDNFRRSALAKLSVSDSDAQGGITDLEIEQYKEDWGIYSTEKEEEIIKLFNSIRYKADLIDKRALQIETDITIDLKTAEQKAEKYRKPLYSALVYELTTKLKDLI